VDPETADEPWGVFEAWLALARERGLVLPESMALATVGASGAPAARVVLYKGRSGAGLSFFTNYNSRKGAELKQNPRAAAVFHWPSLRRQVRIEGRVEKLAEEESDRYFATRPRESQLGAWASEQSQPLESRAQLRAALQRYSERYRGQAIPRPPHWGGYRLMADHFEFWLAHDARLNDRFAFSREGEGWARRLLAP
jgi:pyridoxamine 5'-phosphate oxidase